MKHLGYYWHHWAMFQMGRNKLDLTHDSSMTSSKCDTNLETAEECDTLLVVCIYLFYGWCFSNFREICYIDLTWWVFCWSRCPIWVQVIIQSQHHLQSVFLWFLCILWVVFPVIVTTCASSLVLLGDNYWLQETGTTKCILPLYGKKTQVLHLCTFFSCFTAL